MNLKNLKNLKKIFWLIIITLSTINIASCTTGKLHINNNLNFNPQQFSIINKTAAHNWRLNGKINWKKSKINNAITCYINWQKIDNKSQITFYSALNMQNLAIELIQDYKNNNNQIKIISKNGKNYNNINKNSDINSKNAEIKELQQALNSLSLNLNNLSYWLLGIPNSSLNYILIKNGFKQDNWVINYSDYKLIQNLSMPTKIVLKNLTNKNSIFIKIIITNFTLQ